MSYWHAIVTLYQAPRSNFWAALDDEVWWNYQRLMPLTKAQFLSRVSARTRVPEPWANSLVVYSHGFANDLAAAICRAAEIQHRTRFGGAMVLYSWPATKEPLAGEDLLDRASLPLKAFVAYRHDQGTAERSVGTLTSLLSDLSQAVPPSRTTLVAHSLGTRVLARAVRALPPPSAADGKYNAIALLSPDISAKEFVDELADPLNLRVRRKTSIYHHRDDLALKASQFIHARDQRLGDWPLADRRVESVDITESTRGMGDPRNHSDHLVNTALYDLMWNVVRGMPAECRKERGMAVEENGVWILLFEEARYEREDVSAGCRLPYEPSRLDPRRTGALDRAAGYRTASSVD
jgi:esterase/lipase superfamily enzyme